MRKSFDVCWLPATFCNSMRIAVIWLKCGLPGPSILTLRVSWKTCAFSAACLETLRFRLRLTTGTLRESVIWYAVYSILSTIWRIVTIVMGAMPGWFLWRSSSGGRRCLNEIHRNGSSRKQNDLLEGWEGSGWVCWVDEGFVAVIDQIAKSRICVLA